MGFVLWKGQNQFRCCIARIPRRLNPDFLNSVSSARCPAIQATAKGPTAAKCPAHRCASPPIAPPVPASPPHRSPATRAAAVGSSARCAPPLSPRAEAVVAAALHCPRRSPPLRSAQRACPGLDPGAGVMCLHPPPRPGEGRGEGAATGLTAQPARRRKNSGTVTPSRWHSARRILPACGAFSTSTDTSGSARK